MSKQEWAVDWCKTYHVCGTTRITAYTAKEAESKVLDQIGDFTGSFQYDPGRDYVEAHPAISKAKGLES